ncbi:hypothetical protein HYT52_02525 [Candidatus Woesearchaeota archaeon]|nr:hypothetical protein [Candidatus Woesearchaeota archaeon]
MVTLREVERYANFLPTAGGDIGAYVAKEWSPRLLPERTERGRDQPRFTREEIGRGVGAAGVYIAQNGTLAGIVAELGIPVISPIGAAVLFLGPAALHLYYKSKRR